MIGWGGTFRLTSVSRFLGQRQKECPSVKELRLLQPIDPATLEQETLRIYDVCDGCRRGPSLLNERTDAWRSYRERNVRGGFERDASVESADATCVPDVVESSKDRPVLVDGRTDGRAPLSRLETRPRESRCGIPGARPEHRTGHGSACGGDIGYRGMAAFRSVGKRGADRRGPPTATRAGTTPTDDDCAGTRRPRAGSRGR